jgi:Bifunctional DNA primase/polymerase, N-terminal
MASRLQAALDYADQGRSVIPVEPGAKTPAVRWTRFQVERATESQIRRWWDFADFNIGIVCGRISNLVALDVDLRAGGDSSLAQLESAYRPVGGLEVTTPGGLHRWFTHPGGRIPNSTSVLGRGLDVKADAGMIVAPPSERPDGAYRFGRLFDADVPPLPDWLARLLVNQAKPRSARPTGRAPSKRYLNVAVRGVLADLRATTEGGRNIALFQAACRVLELGAPAAIPAVEQAAREIGLEADEITSTIASALRRVGSCADGGADVFARARLSA